MFSANSEGRWAHATCRERAFRVAQCSEWATVLKEMVYCSWKIQRVTSSSHSLDGRNMPNDHPAVSRSLVSNVRLQYSNIDRSRMGVSRLCKIPKGRMSVFELILYTQYAVQPDPNAVQPGPMSINTYRESA